MTAILKTLNRYDVISCYNKLLNALDLDKEQVILSAGAALVVLGIRNQTSDLDIDLPGSDSNDCDYDLDTSVGAYVDINCINPKIKTMVIDGVCLYSLEELLKQKKSLIIKPNRSLVKIESDLKDIDAILKMMLSQ